MHFYTCSIAPNPQRVAILLKLKGITLETTEVDILKGEHFADDFKTLNPACTLPVLSLEDGTVLTDTIAICYYLDRKYPNKPLFGNDALETAQVIGLMHKLYTEGVMPIAEILRNQGETFKDRAIPGRVNIPQISQLIPRGKLRLAAFWDDMNRALENKTFLVGEQLSQADIDLFVICNFVNWVKEQVPSHCIEISRWYKNVQNIVENL